MPHTVCEVGILGTVLLSIYSGTMFPIFEIFIFDRYEAKNKLAEFFSDRQCIQRDI